MPIYEYQCRDCQKAFEELILRASDAEAVVCPDCGGSHNERLLSAPSLASSSSGGSSGAACVPRGGFS